MALPWIKEFFENRRIPYRETHHHDAYTAQGLAHEEHASGHRVAKVVVCYADEKPVLLVIPATHQVILSTLKAVLGSKQVRLASEIEMGRLFPDCEIGAEPPLPHWSGIALWMDEALRTTGDILFPAGTHRDGLRVAYNDWVIAVGPSVASFSVETGRFPPRPMPSEA